MSKELIRKIAESAKVLLGIIGAIAAIWNFTVPFDPTKVSQLIDFLLQVLLPASVSATLAVSGIRSLYAKQQ